MADAAARSGDFTTEERLNVRGRQERKLAPTNTGVVPASFVPQRTLYLAPVD
jgi:hypothetical protein